MFRQQMYNRSSRNGRDAILLLIGGAIGGALVYVLGSGERARRRNMAIDKMGALARDVGNQLGGTVQDLGNRAQGLVRETVPTRRDNPNPDDLTLRDRVESTLFRDSEYGRDHININVVDGIVEVRGSLPSQAEIDDVIGRVRTVPDVRGVHSYLHLPGTPAPNKAEAIEAS